MAGISLTPGAAENLTAYPIIHRDGANGEGYARPVVQHNTLLLHNLHASHPPRPPRPLAVGGSAGRVQKSGAHILVYRGQCGR
jgi:hypothetical protein